MFIITLTYTKPLEVIDALLKEHIDYLKRQYATGVFLASGRRIPREGGVIFARAQDKSALMDILSEDPFFRESAASYDVVEFAATMTAPGFECLKEA